MSETIIGLIGIVALFILFFLKLPIAFTMMFVGTIGYCLVRSPTAGLSVLGGEAFSLFSSYSLTAIPMFILGGELAFNLGIGSRLFEGAYAFLGRLPGGLAVACCGANAAFGAICGSTTAAAGAMGKITLPVMKANRYSAALATGCVASAGGLAGLIPPSTILIIYGIMTSQSIAKLFVAGIIPGILLFVLLSTVTIFRSIRRPLIAPTSPKPTNKQKISGVIGLAEGFALFALCIGGLSTGWFSPTQCGAALALSVLVMATAERNISWKAISESLQGTVRITCLVMFIVVAAMIFGKFMAISQIPIVMAEWLAHLPVPGVIVILMIMLSYFIGGFFMDSLALLTLTVPIYLPTVLALGYDPIWFGVMLVILGEMGIVTPPVGLNVFVVKGVVPEIPIRTIYSGVWPYVGAIAINAFIILAFPIVVTWLPGLIRI